MLFGGVFGVLGVDSVNAASTDDLMNGVWCISFHPITGGLNLGGCSAQLTSAIYGVTALLVSGTASIFNTLLSFSLSKDILDTGFVKTAWDTTRGFVNMLFILILVTISISIILDLKSYGSKELIKKVVIIALMVNFSLFAARVVIDMGNIVALGFYDAIAIPADVPANTYGVPEKDIAGGIMSAFNPTQLISVKSFGVWRDTNDANSSNGNWVLAMIYSFGILMNVYISYLFFMAGWIFVVRIIWLWLLMAIAPLAFICYTIPDLQDKWNKWWKELFNKSFCIVVFLFFIWLTILITGEHIFDPDAGTGSTGLMDILVPIALQAILVFSLLSKMALKKTKEMCDDGGFGDKVLGLTKAAGGLALGVATGGVGFAASQGIGGWAARTAKATEDSGGGTSALGKLRLKTLRGISKASFAPKSAMFGKEGYQQRVERVSNEEQEYMKSLPEKIKNPKKIFGFTGAKGIETNNLVGQNAQDIYRQNIKDSPIISTIIGRRAGENKFVGDIDKRKKNQEKLNEELVKLERIKKDIKEMQDENVTDEQIKGSIETRDKIEQKIKGLREKIKPKK